MPKYSRKTLIAAIQVLKTLGHSGFDRLLLELELSERSVSSQGNLQDKANALARYVVQYPDHLTTESKRLWDVIVQRALEEDNDYPPGVDIPNVTMNEREAFKRSISEDEASREASVSFTVKAPTPPSAQRPWRPQTEAIISGAMSSSSNLQREPAAQTGKPVSRTRVFIVHGRDEASKEAVARFVERMGFEAIILHEQSNNGRTVIEKFIAHSDVHFAIVLLTPDDLGGLVGSDPSPRARQNVILEWGFFIGALGRENVVALMRGKVELPSDVVGIVWEPYDEGNAWRFKLAKEMEVAGFIIDWRKASN